MATPGFSQFMRSPGRLLAAGACALALALAAPAGASGPAYPAEELRAALATMPRGGEVERFYQARQHRPLWIRDGSLVPAAARVVRLVGESDLDGLDPRAYRAAELAETVAEARRGDPYALARAEVLLSYAFSAYVRDLRRSPDIGMIYVDRELAPQQLTPLAILFGAAAAPSLSDFVDKTARMNPVYAELRRSYAAWLRQSGRDRAREMVIRANLERARALPADPGRRFVLVDAASARLWLYEDGRPRHSMRVIVGKRNMQTPMMAGYIRYVTLNPYWNIPPDLVQERIAPNVLSQGLGYLRNAGYQVTTDWSDNARPVDPKSIDWRAVAAGRKELPVRQLPGPANGMGEMKFMLPNPQGIYLHDTPDKTLFAQDDRRLSAGCVRVEDARRLAAWLFGRTVRPPSGDPELNVDLPEPVPVFITYLTASPEGGRIAFRNDPYGRDATLLARLGSGTVSGAP